ncbi:sulfotransferase domain-containing protein [Planctomycetaceae bacterium SH139]
MKYLFVIGAPKCGTSSFFGHLTAHPRLVGTKPKETYALLSDHHPLAADKAYANLEKLLASCEELANQGPGQQGLRERDGGLLSETIFVEATTHNFYSPEATRAVGSLGAEARAVVMLRRPSRRILSSFRYTKQNLARIPRGFTFAEYVDCLLRRDSATIKQAIGHPASSAILANELVLSDYLQHLERWYDQVGRDQLKVIISEEYFANPKRHIRGLLDWLGVERQPEMDAGLPELKNPTRRVGLPAVQRIARAVNKHAPAGRISESIKAFYFRFQDYCATPDEEDYSASLARLDDYFASQVQTLECYLEKSLECWGVERRQVEVDTESSKSLPLLAGGAE